MAIEKKSKFWEPFWSYQVNSTADLAPRIFIFSIVLDAEYVKSVATFAFTFLGILFQS